MRTSERIAGALSDRYAVDRLIGEGGMASVYLAHDLRHDRDVAVKVLQPDIAAALGAERFLSEIRTTARLQHPHILPLLDSGEAGGLLYYVMPLVTGETLRARMERERQLPIADALRLAREVAGALDYAHRQGVIHRDIKPENILLHDGSALVADFGIALAVQQAGGQRLTQTGLSLGTPQYMSPEQAMGERVIDARSDVYAVAAVLYEMIAGEPPFTGPSVQAIVARVMTEEPRSLVAQRRAVPPGVEAAVLRALEKLPADRFATAAEFAAALENETNSTGIRMVARRAPASRAMLAAASVAFVLLTAAAVRGWMRPLPAPEVVRYRVYVDSASSAHDWMGELAVSPDGSRIVRSGGPKGMLMIRHRDSLDFHSIPGTEDAVAPFFSPDGTQLGYIANDRVYVMPVQGGPATAIADSIAVVESMTWGSDNRIYRSADGAGGASLGRVDAKLGAKIEVLTQVDTAAGEDSHLYPELLPDQKTLLFQAAFRNGRRAIAILDLSKSDRKHTLLFDGVRARYASSGHLIYTTLDGKLWAVPFSLKDRTVKGTPAPLASRIPVTVVGPADFALSRAGTLAYSMSDDGANRSLVLVARDGTRQTLDDTWRGEFSSPAVSADGKQLAVTKREGAQSHIWIRPLAGGQPRQLTSARQGNGEPSWSPDGRFISYISTGGDRNTGDVWRQPVDGGASPQRMTKSDRPLSEQVWARDGSLLVRTTTPARGSGDVLRLPPGDSTLVPLIATPRVEYSPAPSPDGRWIAYVSNLTGRYEVYVSPASDPASARWLVSSAGGYTPRWSSRGDELYFLDMRRQMKAARIRNEPVFAVQDVRTLFDASDYAQTSLSRHNFDVTSDGRFLMVLRADSRQAREVVVVEHLDTELKAQKP